MQPVRDLMELIPRQADEPALAWALAWSLAAGPDLAARARCGGVRDGVLRLEAADAQARRHIESVAPELRRELNRLLGGNRVQRLEFAPHPHG